MRCALKLVVSLAAWVGACGGSDVAGVDPGGDDDQVAQTADVDETALDADASIDALPGEPQPSPVEPTPTPAADYPPGPYGTGYLEVIQDLAFFDPWTGATPHLSDYYMSPDVSVLLVTSGTGWCIPCMNEAWELIDLYGRYQPRGLGVLFTLFEDQYGNPLFQDDASDDEITRDLIFFQSWKENLGRGIGLSVRAANYPVVVDRDFVLAPYFPTYPEVATPLNIIIRTSDMRILYRGIGFDGHLIEQLLRGWLD